ncbi:PSD1 and planctomycete cytochrome C domain-containing protein [Neorhodopirellula lusitana]|uniref:PSD1 and planctomycete cytochrome C domain-containing protein n=1 Tax=Neorhodopirellula lusitana TaxID=445327 RepID=UPI00384B2083
MSNHPSLPYQRKTRRIAILAVVTLLVETLNGTTGLADQTQPIEKQSSGDSTLITPDHAAKLFTLKVLPLLKDKCLGCHGVDTDDMKGAFSVATREALLQGGESDEPSIVPGQPDEGTLIEAITWAGIEMPPKENDRLSDPQIELVRNWIAAGAPWPDEAEQKRFRDEDNRQRINSDGMIVTSSGGTSEEWTNRRYQPGDLWAFAPVKSASELLPAPLVEAGPSESEVINYFVNRQLSQTGLTASTSASPSDLIRRATYDLTGLPPTPEETARFQRDYQSNPATAWEQLIDRLLESDRYGEHWARHWFDVTRYSDTGGMANDYERSNMWRYRDYVIRSFNDDKPYDQFIIEQIAGDELADASVRIRNHGNEDAVIAARLKGDYTPEEAEQIIATGFLRMGPWDNAMVEPAEARQIFLDDLVNITGQTILATTMRCCKCHDHKFDPLPTRDYYRMYAAFATTQMAERPAPFLPTESRERFDSGKSHVQRMLDYATRENNRLIDKRETAGRAWYIEHNLPYRNEADRKGLPDDKKPARHVGLTVTEQGQLKVRSQDVWIWTRRLERYQPLAQSVYNSSVTASSSKNAKKLRFTANKKQANQKPQTLVNYILQGGGLTARGDEVGPGVLSATSIPANPDREDPYRLTDEVDGRRLELARWIANPGNPLTSRAIVNRIWQYHFGKPIAGNPNNFGVKGAKPTHPELLDYLASNFVKNGWTLKRLHRAIMLSQVYQRSTIPNDTNALSKIDPNNDWLSHFPRRRLSAEELRDGILAITGELQHGDGGLPIMPEINMEVALQPRMIQFSLAPAYQPSPTPSERNRRSIYAYSLRGQADPFGELFNQPNPNDSCEMRESAAVTPQVFALLNSDLITDRSIALATRLERERSTPEQQIDRAYELLFGRNPTPAETNRLSRYYSDMVTYHESTTPAAVTYPKSITRSLVEEFSGDIFEYEEILPVFENYTPDTKPVDVNANTRALADVCLLLLNTNEFIYLD